MLSKDQLLSDLIATNLGKRGYEVSFTSLAGGSFCRWSDLGVELLLLDVEPPGHDALEAVRALGDLGWNGNVPVVALCDEMPNVNGKEATPHRGVQWVVKPFAVEVLLSMVREALGDAGGNKTFRMGVT